MKAAMLARKSTETASNPATPGSQSHDDFDEEDSPGEAEATLETKPLTGTKNSTKQKSKEEHKGKDKKERKKANKSGLKGEKKARRQKKEETRKARKAQ